MNPSVDLKEVVNHIANGTLFSSLCRICLLPLDRESHSIITKICQKDKEYSIADIFYEVFHIQLAEDENSKVCTPCFLDASNAYRVHITAKRSNEILNYYVDKLHGSINSDLANEVSENSESLCFTLPVYVPHTQEFDYNLDGLYDYENEPYEEYISDQESVVSKAESKNDMYLLLVKDEKKHKNNFIFKGINNKLKPNENKSNNLVHEKEDQNKEDIMKKKVGRQRGPMPFMNCSQCPAKYRHFRKMKFHMEQDHGVDLFMCKICNMVIENEKEFCDHLKLHKCTYVCDYCHTSFKSRNTLIHHLKRHEEQIRKKLSGEAPICEVCAEVLDDEDELEEHMEKKHSKNHTCYYCGRTYKCLVSLISHIKKHEATQCSEKNKESGNKDITRSKEDRKEHQCYMCNKSFVDSRALIWHKRLHNNERPYKCDVCGKKFITRSRRNHHTVCSHTAPSLRCPLCPSLFHVISMLNSHIKKVHLTKHKRRNKPPKYSEVTWKTRQVPIHELSVSVQNELLNLQTQNKDCGENSLLDKEEEFIGNRILNMAPKVYSRKIAEPKSKTAKIEVVPDIFILP